MKWIAVIGGGAAGLCCACDLLRQLQGRATVTIFEQNSRVGKKLLATGNGRCNLTNLHASPASYPPVQRAFVTPALTRFSPEKILGFFRSLSLYTHADGEGRVYPLSNQAAGVLDALRLECTRLGAAVRCDTAVTSIRPKSGRFLVGGEMFDFVVLALGGKAAVKIFQGYDLLKQLSIPCSKTAPGLVKLTTADPLVKSLKGIRAAASLRLLLGGREAMKETGELQFADGALSGIAVMNLSSCYARQMLQQPVRAEVEADFVPSMETGALTRAVLSIAKSGQRETCEDLLSGFVPKRLGMALCKAAGLRADQPTAALSGAQVETLCRLCKAYRFPITGTGSFADAQVTVGGAARTAVHAETLESKQYPNLYLCGELLDVDGPCGGFNLQWAFASARLCAASISEKLV